MLKFFDKFLNLILKEGRVSYINGKIFLPAPLCNEEENEQLTLFRAGSIEARNVLIEHNLRLVVYVAKRYENDIYNLPQHYSFARVREKNIALFWYILPILLVSQAL